MHYDQIADEEINGKSSRRKGQIKSRETKNGIIVGLSSEIMQSIRK